MLQKTGGHEPGAVAVSQECCRLNAYQIHRRRSVVTVL